MQLGPVRNEEIKAANSINKTGEAIKKPSKPRDGKSMRLNHSQMHVMGSHPFSLAQLASEKSVVVCLSSVAARGGLFSVVPTAFIN